MRTSKAVKTKSKAINDAISNYLNTSNFLRKVKRLFLRKIQSLFAEKSNLQVTKSYRKFSTKFMGTVYIFSDEKIRI